MKIDETVVLAHLGDAVVTALFASGSSHFRAPAILKLRPEQPQASLELLNTIAKAPKWLETCQDSLLLKCFREAFAKFADCNVERMLEDSPPLYVATLQSLCNIVSHLSEEHGESVQLLLLEQCFSFSFYSRRLAQDTLAFIGSQMDTGAVMALLSTLADLMADLASDSPECEFARATLTLMLRSVDEDVLGLFHEKYALSPPKPSDKNAIIWSFIQSKELIPEPRVPQHCALLLSWSLQQLMVESVDTVLPGMHTAVLGVINMYRIV